MRMKLRYAAAVCAAALTATTVQAQTEPPKPMTFEQVLALVHASLPPVIGRDNSDLVKNLAGAAFDTQNPLSETFEKHLPALSQVVFGRRAPNRDPSCSRPLTSTGDVDPGLCTSTFGDQGGTGVFQVLSYSKDMTRGDITFLKRPEQKELTPDTIPAVQTDREALRAAYNAAVEFGKGTIGLPSIEIATPPTGIDPTFLVTTMTLGFGQEKAVGQVAFMHVVHLKRAVKLPKPLMAPAGTTQTPPLTHVLAPGEATFFMNGGGVQAARVEGWASLPVDPRLNPGAAKSDTDLADEIARELFAGGGQQIAKVQMAFALSPSAYPNPDDPNPPLCPACQVLRPVLRVVMYAFDTKVESPQGEIAAPGLVHEFQLVNGTPEAPVRPAQQ